MHGNVTWEDYDGSQFGDMSNELQKALLVGDSLTNPGTGAGVGFPIRVESLDKTLKNVTFGSKHAVLWKSIYKSPAYSTVEQFNRLTNVGSDVGGFIEENDTPETNDSTYERAYEKVKFMGTTREVSFATSLVKSGIGDVEAQEVVNGTNWLLRIIERSLFFGDETMIPVQINGIKKNIQTSAPNPTLNVIDLRGGPLTEDVINDGAMIIRGEPNYGEGTDIYMSDGVYGDISKQLYPAERYNPQQYSGNSNGMMGVPVKGMYTQAGPMMFNPDVLIQEGPLAPTAGMGNASKRPSTPTQSVAPAAGALGGGETSYFAAADAGDYRYKVVAVNRYGYSAAVTMTGPVTVAAGQKVTMTVADGSTVGTAFDLYRSPINGAAGTEKLVGRYARSGATTVITDFNSNLPGTSNAFMIQNNIEFFTVRQLAPFMRVPLATVSTSKRWMQLLFLGLLVFAPGKAVVYKNVGRAPGSKGTSNAVLTTL